MACLSPNSVHTLTVSLLATPRHTSAFCPAWDLLHQSIITLSEEFRRLIPPHDFAMLGVQILDWHGGQGTAAGSAVCVAFASEERVTCMTGRNSGLITACSKNLRFWNVEGEGGGVLRLVSCKVCDSHASQLESAAETPSVVLVHSVLRMQSGSLCMSTSVAMWQPIPSRDS